MNNWETLLHERTFNVKDAIKLIGTKRTIFLAAYCNEPQTLVEELVNQKERLRGAKLYVNVAGSPALYAQAECMNYFQIKTFLSSTVLRGAMERGDCDYIPINLSEVPKLIEKMEVDVAFIQVSPPDEDGYCNLGISIEAVHNLVKKAHFSHC